MPNLHNRSVVAQALSRVRQRLSGLSLQSRFLLIMGTSSLFITLLFWTMFNNFTEHLLGRIGSRFAEKQMFYDKARTLQPLIREIVMASQSADAAPVKEWALHEKDPELYRRSMEELRNRFHSDNFFVAIASSGNFYYYDAARQLKDPLRYSLDPASPDDAWILDFIKSGEDHGINISSNGKLGLHKIWVMVSIQDGTRVVGVIGTGIDLGEFTRNASNVHLPGATNMFINRNAEVQIYNDVNHFDFPNIENHSEPQHRHIQITGAHAGNQWVHQSIRKLDDGTTGIETEFVRIDGKRYLASMIALPEVGWYDLSLLDLSVMMPTADFVRMVLAIAAGTLGLLAILAFTLHKLVLKPVATLTDAVSRIRQGDYSAKPLEESSGEVQQLISQFQDMAGAIYNTQQWLEDEIEKRTRQLSDAQNFLEITLHREKDGRETQANLMALMAHEMRSPIAVIGNTAQMLDMLAQQEHLDWQPRIEKIMRSVRQLATLMDTFLSEKWLDMDKHGLNRVMGNLNQLCEEVKAGFVDSHARPVHFQPCDGDARLCADWNLVRIAIINLLDNARKYSSRSDEIYLKVLSGKPGMLCIEVSDRGVGIPSELQRHVFEKFARGRHETDIQGSGLGLYLVNWIARFHGGYTEVNSEQGQGSTFRLCLPLCEPDSAEVSATQTIK